MLLMLSISACAKRMLLPAVVTIFIAVFIRSIYDGDQDSWKCHRLLNSGRWARNTESRSHDSSWYPAGCVLHDYQAPDIEACLSNQTLTFKGDSYARQLFWAVTERTGHGHRRVFSEKHANHSVHAGTLKLEFLWDPFLNVTHGLHTTTIIGAGLWFLRYLEDPWRQFEPALEHLADEAAMANLGIVPVTPVIVLPLLNMIPDRLDHGRRSKFSSSAIWMMNDILRDFELGSNLTVLWSSSSMNTNQSDTFMADGLHLKSVFSSIHANLILNRICNPSPGLAGRDLRATCCRVYNYSLIQVLTLSWLIIMVILSAITIAVSRQRGYTRETTLAISRATGFVGSAVLYCVLADRTHMFEKSGKVESVELFSALTVACFLAGLCVIQYTAPTCDDHKRPVLLDSFLSREQSDELKGMMQVSLLLYHYFGMSKVLWIYQIVRVMVGMYLFLTGYGHTLYFLRTLDFSGHRVASVILRLNLLSCTLAFAMGMTWDFYYFPALSTFWFLVIYATLFHVPKDISSARLFLRTTSSALLCKATLHVTVFLWMFVDRYIAIPFDIREFLFRTNLDFCAPFTGMLLGIIQVQSKPGFRLIKFFQSRPAVRLALAIVLVLLLVAYFVVGIQLFNDKFEYNKFHPMISLVPIISYLLLRNSTVYLRYHHLPLFAWIGRCSLETFVLQYHIWLAADTKGLLHLGLIDRPETISTGDVLLGLESWRYWFEKVVITAIFLWVSHRTAQCTNVIVRFITDRIFSGGRGWAVPSSQ